MVVEIAERSEQQTTDVSHVVIEYIDPNLLKPHPYNSKIYGDEESVDDLEKQVAAQGRIIEPIIVNPDLVTISGHRRRRVGIKLKMKVPIVRRTYASELDELEALLLANVYREKTVVQKPQEGATWEMIYQRRAKETQEAQGSQGVLGKEHGKEGGRGKKKNPLGALVPQGGFPPPLQQPLTQPNEETIEEPVSQHVQEPPL